MACWGRDYKGQSTVPTTLQAPGNTAFGQITAGNAHACQVRRDGSLACWGDNAEGKANAPAGTFTQVVAGDSHSCAIGSDGKVTCWGAGQQGTFGSPMPIGSLGWGCRGCPPEPVNTFTSLALLQSGISCGLKTDGSGQCWHPVMGSTDTLPGPFRSLTGSGMQLCTISDGGAGQCWTPGNAPQSLPGDWQVLQPGLDHQCGLKVDGSIECMGDSSSGQLTDTPPATDKFRALSVGWNHACAIRTNGQLACWGSNVNGQTAAPTGTFVQVAAGNTFTCAIRSDGVRLCWGADNHGQAPFLQLTPASATLAGGLVGSAHAGVQFTLIDGAGPYPLAAPAAFAVVDGALPPGMALSAGGLLSGTPTAVGDYSFTVEGEDANGFVGRREYLLPVVIPDNSLPVIGYTLAPPTPDGNNGWYRSNVGVSWSVSDAESTISSKTGCTPSTLSTDTLGAITPAAPPAPAARQQDHAHPQARCHRADDCSGGHDGGEPQRLVSRQCRRGLHLQRRHLRHRQLPGHPDPGHRRHGSEQHRRHRAGQRRQHQRAEQRGDGEDRPHRADDQRRRHQRREPQRLVSRQCRRGLHLRRCALRRGQLPGQPDPDRRRHGSEQHRRHRAGQRRQHQRAQQRGDGEDRPHRADAGTHGQPGQHPGRR